MVDILIIGAGPAGISMAAEARATGIGPERILLLEKSHEHSFSIKKYYPDTKRVTANYKGFDAVCTGVMCLVDSSKQETVSYLDRTILACGAPVHYNETVSALFKHDGEQRFTVTTNTGTYDARVVVIAIGVLGRPNKPDYRLPPSLKGRLLFDLTTIPVERSSVLVVGGGDSASEYCQYLVEKGNTVSLSYRQREFFRMNRINRESLLALADRGAVSILTGSTIAEVRDRGGRPEVAFQETEYGTRDYDFVVYALGGSTPQNFLKTIGITFNGDEPHLTRGYETNVPGLFLVGDLSAGSKGGSIIWAFNSANTAMARILSTYLPASS